MTDVQTGMATFLAWELSNYIDPQPTGYNWWASKPVGTWRWLADRKVILEEKDTQDDFNDYGYAPIYLIFRVERMIPLSGTDTSYYRVDGTSSSYQQEWDGPLYEVTPSTETKTVFKKIGA